MSTAPKVHFHLFQFPVCTGRNWQEWSMKFTKQKSKVTCNNCRRMLGLKPHLSEDRKLHIQGKLDYMEGGAGR